MRPSERLTDVSYNVMKVMAENGRHLGSEHVLWGRVDFLESFSSTLVQNLLGREALVLIEVVGGHATSEVADIVGAELGQDGLSGRAFIFSWEAIW